MIIIIIMIKVILCYFEEKKISEKIRLIRGNNKEKE